MAVQDVTIQWLYDESIVSTLVEFKKESDATYIAPQTAENPTANPYYILSVEPNVTYNLRLTAKKSAKCLPVPKTYRFTVTPPPPPAITYCCPTGYTLSPDSSYCYKIEEVAATAPTGGTPENAVAAPNMVYSTFGSYLYNSGYNINGTGTAQQINFNVPFWINGPGNSTDGPLNRTALWSTTTVDNQDVGFSVCLDIPNTKTYYVGIGTDNYGIIKVDGNAIIAQDPDALGTQYGGGADIAFKIWHIYPVEITSGPHILELLGHNSESIAAMGAEIYDNTKDEILNSVGYSDLNVVFSTKDYIGQPIQIGGAGTGYTCPSGYALASCETPPVCRKTLNTVSAPC